MLRIVTDTIPNLPTDIVDRYNIALIPAYVNFGSESLREAIDISSSEFYERLPQQEELPQTTQPAVTDFIDLYQQLISRNPDTSILSIHISHKLSGTIHSGEQAVKKFPGKTIRLFDTFSVGVGHGLMVVEACEMNAKGYDIEAITKRLTHMRENTRYYMILDTLDYLAKSGRIGRAARVMGTMLEMKPTLMLKRGAVESVDRHRSYDEALKSLENLVIQECKGKRNIRLGVTHSARPRLAEQLRQTFGYMLNVQDILTAEIGPTLGVHVGPGAVGLAWYIAEELD